MSEMDTTTLFVNEASAEVGFGSLAKTIGNLDGVCSVELGAPDLQADTAPLGVQRATITYDPEQTTATDVRASLQDLGYTVMQLSAISE
ncbi:MAG: heavy-metal-associated domain-containing protein [Chloroflexota bacterium]|nr:heavy-metal-associated domain-containing protein [Chloroflexota bacterium]